MIKLQWIEQEVAKQPDVKKGIDIIPEESAEASKKKVRVRFTLSDYHYIAIIRKDAGILFRFINGSIGK